MRSERGDVLVAAMGITCGFLLVMLIFFDFFAVHFARQTSADAADAAALGAANQVGEEAKKLVPAFLQSKVDALWVRVDADVNAHMSKWTDDTRAALQDQVSKEHPDWKQPDVDAEVARLLSPMAQQERDQYQDQAINGQVHNEEVRSAIKGKGNAPVTAWLQEFSTAQDRGCMLKQAAGSGPVQAAGNFFAQRNHVTGAATTSVTTTTELQVESTVTDALYFPIFRKQIGSRTLDADSKAKLDSFYGMAVDFSGTCSPIGS